MIENETIKHQLNHRAIRAFKDQTLSEEQLTTLYEVARHTATSMFMQQFSILHITDEEKRKQIREITGQKYVGANGDLFIFISIYIENNKFLNKWEMMMDVCIQWIFSSKHYKTQC